MNGLIEHDPDASEYVEVDPTGRYGRYNEILGKGASKIVYRAFDEYEGIEVAWNQVKLTDFLQRPEDLERLYSEIHLLKTLKHKNIMTYYTSWVDTANRNINFVTEMFTSGTLRQYRLKHKKVNIRAVKHWCRQILSGLLYLHSLDHPVIHRDLKCDNIFINGNQGEVKIGDLGLAAILRKSHAARCVGTPEFMAPEVYAEEYNELVDIYSFGMCVLEMVTFEYPYSECTHSAQIYKKVTSGKKPEALYKVKDPEVRQFVEKCLATVSHRLSAKELLMDLFLQEDDGGYDLRPIDSYESVSLAQFPYQNCGALMNGCYTYPRYEEDHELDHQALEFETSEIDLFASLEDDQLANTDISIKGKRRGDGGIFLRLRIADEEGRVRNIYFPFDIETDTALIVATEMVSELDITGQDVTRIAEMIDEEIASLVPDWKGGLSLEEVEGCTNSNAGYSHSRAPSFSLSDYVSSDKTRTQNIQVLHCSAHESAAVSGRFEEVMYYQTDSDGVQYTDIWAQRESCEPEESSSQKGEKFNKTDDHGEDDDDRDPRTPYNSPVSSVVCDPEHENEIRKELRWLKAKYQIQLRELKDHQLGGKSGKPSLTVLKRQNGFRNKKMTVGSPENRPDKNDLKIALDRHFASYFPSNGDQGKGANMGSRDIQNASNDSYSEEDMVTAKSFYTGTLLPSSLHRATSLPVDAVDC